MKRLTTILAAAAAIALASCKKEVASNDLFGKWKLVHVKSQHKIDGKITDETDEDVTYDAFVSFYNTPSAHMFTGSKSQSYMLGMGGRDKLKFKWETNGNEIWIYYSDTNDNDTRKMKVDKLTTDQLVVSETDNSVWQGANHYYYRQETYRIWDRN